MDADGYFTIKKSTYHQRTLSDTINANYSAQVGLRQVTPQVPYLLKETFGGCVAVSKPNEPNRRMLYQFQATDRPASRLSELLLPYLRIKRRQAELLVELQQTKQRAMLQPSHWFEREFPRWQEMELITTEEAAKMLGYAPGNSIYQAIMQGVLLALPDEKSGFGPRKPRIPKLLVERLCQLPRAKDGRLRLQATEITHWRERLHAEIKELNKVGTGSIGKDTE